AARPRRARCHAELRLPPVSGAAGACESARRLPVRRRAADVRHWPRADGAAAPAHAGRADARPGAGARRTDLRHRAHNQRRRRYRAAGRAERPPGAHARHARLCARVGQAGARGRGPRAARRRATQTRVSGALTMPVYHVRYTCAADYNARRLPYRPAHLAHVPALRDDGGVVAGGPERDGAAAHILYRVSDRAALDRLIAENEFQRAGLFVAHAARAFSDFVEPIERLPHDAGWKVTLVDGAP